MPATTRSKQTKLEDVGAGKPDDVKAAKAGKPKAATKDTSRKRKAAETAAESGNKSTKKHKPVKSEHNGEMITINRAPVLELWSSCVAQFMHPSTAWTTCLSAGGAISTITAISKGRSIGTIDRPDAGEAEKKKQERKKKAEKEGGGELEVMSFKLQLDKDGNAMVGDKPKKAGEEALKKKYGGLDPYEKAKKTFEDGLNGWKGKEEELNSAAFKMYEDFRPTIPPGQSGWGRKGQLNLETVKSVIDG